MRLNLRVVSLRHWRHALSRIFLLASIFWLQSNAVVASSYKEKKVRFDPQVIKFCVNQLLYEDTFPNGNPVGDRTILDPASAARACKGVSSKDEAIEVKRCVNGLLYESVFRDGSPSGERTIFDPSSAAQACQICHEDEY